MRSHSERRKVDDSESTNHSFTGRREAEGRQIESSTSSPFFIQQQAPVPISKSSVTSAASSGTPNAVPSAALVGSPPLSLPSPSSSHSHQHRDRGGIGNNSRSNANSVSNNLNNGNSNSSSAAAALAHPLGYRDSLSSRALPFPAEESESSETVSSSAHSGFAFKPVSVVICPMCSLENPSNAASCQMCHTALMIKK